MVLRRRLKKNTRNIKFLIICRAYAHINWKRSIHYPLKKKKNPHNQIDVFYKNMKCLKYSIYFKIFFIDIISKKWKVDSYQFVIKITFIYFSLFGHIYFFFLFPIHSSFHLSLLFKLNSNHFNKNNHNYNLTLTLIL